MEGGGVWRGLHQNQRVEGMGGPFENALCASNSPLGIDNLKSKGATFIGPYLPTFLSSLILLILTF